MTTQEFYNLKAGDFIIGGKKGLGSLRKILRVSKRDSNETVMIVLTQIGYSYLGMPKKNRTVVYCSCDKDMFQAVNN